MVKFYFDADPKTVVYPFSNHFFSQKNLNGLHFQNICIWKHEKGKSGKFDCLVLTETLAHHSDTVRGQIWTQHTSQHAS